MTAIVQSMSLYHALRYFLRAHLQSSLTASDIDNNEIRE